MPVVDNFAMLIEEEGKTNSLVAKECENKKKKHHADVEAEGRVAGPIDVVVDYVLNHHGKIPMAVASSGWRDHVLKGLERIGILQ